MKVGRLNPFFLLVFLAVALTTTLLASAGEKDKPDEVILAEFTWNGEKVTVTLDELEKEISELPKYKQRKYATEEGRKEYLTLMAESRLVLKAAEEKRYGARDDLLDKVDDYLRDLMIEKITDEMVESKIKVTEEEMKRYYEEHKDEFVEPEKIRLTCITIQAEKGKEEEAKKKAEEIYRRIKEKGEDIKKVAKEISDKGENMGPGGRNNGDTGFFSRNSFPSAKKFTEAAFSLKPGQMYDGILEQDIGETKYYMIFRCEERKPARQKEFSEEDVQRSIKRTLERQKREELTNKWISSLKKKAKVKLYPDRIPEDVKSPKKSPVEIVLAEFKWGGRKYKITLQDVQDSFNKMSKYKRSRYKGKEGIEKRLNEILEDMLKVKAAEDKGYNVDLDIARKTTEYLNQLMVEKIVEDEVDAKVNVTEDEMKQYYEEHKDEFVEPEKIRLTCITIQAEKGKEEEAKKKAEEIYKRIKEKGEDIKKIAKEISDKGENMGPGGRNNGDTGFFDRDTYPMAKEFTKAAFSLKPGQMYEGVLEQDIRGTKYYMVFRCEERKPKRQKKFSEEDVKREIRRELEREKRRQLLESWLNGLKKRANFKIYLDRLPPPKKAATSS